MTEHTPTPRPFAEFLRMHGRGRSHDELSEALHTLVGRVRDTGKKGSLTFTVVVEPQKRDDRVVLVSDKITIKLPEHDRPAGIWFVGNDGNLQRDDPNQPELEGLRAVDPLDVDEATGEIKDAR